MESSPFVFQLFFPVLLALGIFEFIVLTKAKNSIDSFAAVFFIVGAMIALIVFGGNTSVVAVIALVLAAYVAAAPVGMTLGEEIQDRFAGVFYVLVIIAVAAVYLPSLVFVVVV